MWQLKWPDIRPGPIGMLIVANDPTYKLQMGDKKEKGKKKPFFYPSLDIYAIQKEMSKERRKAR